MKTKMKTKKRKKASAVATANGKVRVSGLKPFSVVAYNVLTGEMEEVLNRYPTPPVYSKKTKKKARSKK